MLVEVMEKFFQKETTSRSSAQLWPCSTLMARPDMTVLDGPAAIRSSPAST